MERPGLGAEPGPPPLDPDEERSMRIRNLAVCSLLAACASAPTPRPPTLEHVATATVRPPTPAHSTGAAPRAVQGDVGWRGNFSGMLGYREFDEGDWDPLDQQFALGLEVDLRPRASPLGIEFGVQGSFDSDEDDGFDLSVSVVELYVGPRLTFDLSQGRLHPYLGGGVSLMRADTELALDLGGATLLATDDDHLLAAYAHAGLLIDVSDSVHIGFDVRGVFGSDFEFDGGGIPIVAESDYVQAAVLIGTHW